MIAPVFKLIVASLDVPRKARRAVRAKTGERRRRPAKTAKAGTGVENRSTEVYACRNRLRLLVGAGEVLR